MTDANQPGSSIDWSLPAAHKPGEYREFTPEQRAYWAQAVSDEQAAAPETEQRYRFTQEAIEEQSVSGELRRAIHHSKVYYDALSRQTGVDAAAISEFMCGRQTLDSDAFGRLAQAYNLHLAAIP